MNAVDVIVPLDQVIFIEIIPPPKDVVPLKTNVDVPLQLVPSVTVPLQFTFPLPLNTDVVAALVVKVPVPFILFEPKDIIAAEAPIVKLIQFKSPDKVYVADAEQLTEPKLIAAQFIVVV